MSPLGIKAKTLNDWNEAGRRICKGAKMVCRDELGAPMFSERDTYAPRPGGYRRRSASHFGHGAGDWDDDPGFSDLGIETFQG